MDIPEALHGKASGYKRGCRCDLCRDNWNAYMRARRKTKVIPDQVQHGLSATYSNWGCRCEPCAVAKSNKGREYLYGLTDAQYQSMLSQHDGGCWICGARGKLFVDHCHESREVRGLLCMECNTGLGKLGDSISALKRAIKYLEGAK